MKCLSTIEAEYYAAKARLQDAQQEKMEAAADFLAARTALQQSLETLWPSCCECGTQFGYDKTAYGQYQTR